MMPGRKTTSTKASNNGFILNVNTWKINIYVLLFYQYRWTDDAW